MNWKNLKDNLCPKDGKPLIVSASGLKYLCASDFCSFSVSKQKFEEIIKNLYNPKPRVREPDRSNW